LNKYRTHNCNELRKDDLDKDISISGWINKKRDHGNLLFIDLRDNYGITQCIIDKENKNFLDLEKTQLETVIKVNGKVVNRSDETINKDIETGEDIEKPNDYKLSNLRLIGDDLFYAEVFNSDNTFNKIHINKNNFKIEYNNWFYLKEIKGWMYSKFGEKIVFRKDPVNNKDIDDQTKTEKNTVLENEDKAKDRENKMSDFNKRKEKRKVIFSLERWYSSERNSKGVFLKQLKSSKKQIIKSYNIKLKEIVIYRMPGNYNREESFTAYIFSNITDLKIFKEMISINENVELYYENLEKHTLYYIN